MNIILLSGGSGKRLWPLSNDVRSKQFLKVFTKEDGTKESMAQRMYRMLKKIDPKVKITIATGENQISQIKTQLGENVEISIEPTRRDTFPAIALSIAFLKKQGVGLNETVIVCPVDPYVEENYYGCLKLIYDEAEKENSANLTLMGIEPTYPSEKYGYIIPEKKDLISKVKEFKEKPDVNTAKMYIECGALWNGGVFAFKMSYLLSIMDTMFGTEDYAELYKNYHLLDKISFDYAVVEKEKNINVVRFKGQWKDLGTWNTFTEAMTEESSGNVTTSDCDNTHIVNELSVPLIALGIKDSIIAATPDGILVSSKEKSRELKTFVEDSRPMYERCNWGEYKVLEYIKHVDKNNTLVKELVILPGKHISYHYHNFRTEIWNIVEGSGLIITEKNKRNVQRGDVVIIPVGMKHAIKALTELHIIEVQIGEELTEDDVQRLDWNWSN